MTLQELLLQMQGVDPVAQQLIAMAFCRQEMGEAADSVISSITTRNTAAATHGASISRREGGLMNEAGEGGADDADERK
jgi:hypothetical protein